jgi:hypothetical protein
VRFGPTALLPSDCHSYFWSHCLQELADRPSRFRRMPRWRLLTLIHLPVSSALKAELENTVLGIVTFGAPGTFQIASPRCALLIILLRNRKARAAATGNQVQLQVGIGLRNWLAAACHQRSSSAIAIELRLRLLACKTFLRNRSDLGVTSTNSSSAMNSIACSRFRFR